MIRTARRDDVEGLLDLADERRTRYASYEPVFWRPAVDALDRQRGYFLQLLSDDSVVTLVDEDDGRLAGFVIGRLQSPPPVYDPGGPVYLVDDFVVADRGASSSSGQDLLTGLRTEARRRGAVLLVVVCGHLDGTKRDLLRAAGLRITSEWWTELLSEE